MLLLWDFSAFRWDFSGFRWDFRMFIRSQLVSFEKLFEKEAGKKMRFRYGRVAQRPLATLLRRFKF